MRITGDGNAELRDVWVSLTAAEARQVLHALQFWADDEEGYHDPGWHMHITDSGRELTVAIDPSAAS